MRRREAWKGSWENGRYTQPFEKFVLMITRQMMWWLGDCEVQQLVVLVCFVGWFGGLPHS